MRFSLNQFNSSQNKGYTLLFAVITATIVLGVGVFILNVSRKQFELSVSAKNSAAAFYAADSGIECALSDANWVIDFSSTSPSTLNCGNGTVDLEDVSPPEFAPAGMLITDPADANNIVRQRAGYISLSYTDGSEVTNQCVRIIITTGWHATANDRTTVIDARGYNECVVSGGVLGPDISRSTTVERALRLTQSGIW